MLGSALSIPPYPLREKVSGADFARPSARRIELRLLEAVRILGMEKETRFYQALASELYGLVHGLAPSGHRRCSRRVAKVGDIFANNVLRAGL